MKSISINFLVLVFLVFLSCGSENSRQFYVDPEYGNDDFNGTFDKPFQTIDKALQMVSDRVKDGIRSDKIFLRGGVYRKESETTLYYLNLKGTAEDYSLFSAMPCDSTSPGAVKRKSGRWYEKVVFDDAWIVSTQWEKVEKNSKIWKTSPGYIHLEWTNQNLWPWTAFGFPLTNQDESPKTTSFTVAPYLLLNDGDPSVWVNSPDSIKHEGQHFYDHTGKTLYMWPAEDKNPNNCKIETWYGGNEDFEIGTLHLDGEGRALFDGNLQFASIRGIEFRMFNKLFELHRRKYDSESERVIQRDVLFEDNECRYGWIQILLDANTVLDSIPGLILPRYGDRSRWIVRNNIFYRPSREVCQLHGDDHVFKENVIVDHLGPWAGPAACVSAVNTRNTRNFVARNNYFTGQGNNPFHSGSVFMIESGVEHADKNGDYILGGQTYENNLIANVSSGAAFVLGKGGARLRDITVRNNIIKTNKKSPAILLGSPHKNLFITGNIFYDQRRVLEINRFGHGLDFDSLASTIKITENMFVNNESLLDEKLNNQQGEGNVKISNNLYFNNKESVKEVNAMIKDPQFKNPAQFDFSHPEIIYEGEKIEIDTTVHRQKADWSQFRVLYPSEIKSADNN